MLTVLAPLTRRQESDTTGGRVWERLTLALVLALKERVKDDHEVTTSDETFNTHFNVATYVTS